MVRHCFHSNKRLPLKIIAVVKVAKENWKVTNVPHKSGRGLQSIHIYPIALKVIFHASFMNCDVVWMVRYAFFVKSYDGSKMNSFFSHFMPIINDLLHDCVDFPINLKSILQINMIYYFMTCEAHMGCCMEHLSGSRQPKAFISPIANNQ